MATLPQSFPKKAGKTVAPRANQEVLQNSESEEELKSPSSEDGSEEGQPATQQEGADAFQAAPPVQEDLEQLIDPDTVSVDQVKDYVQSELEAVPVMYLRWDTQQKWGQIRVLNPQLVEYYIKVIEKEPPRQPVRVLVRNMGSGICFFFTPNRRNIIPFHRYPIRSTRWATHQCSHPCCLCEYGGEEGLST